MSSQAEKRYQKKYYRKNKERLLAYRRERYQNDPEYREQMKKLARLHNRYKAIERLYDSHLGDRIFSLREISDMIKKAYPHTLNLVKKYFPKPDVQRGNRKYYTRKHVELIVLLFSIRKIPYKALSSAMYEFWDKDNYYPWEVKSYVSEKIKQIKGKSE